MSRKTVLAAVGLAFALLMVLMHVLGPQMALIAIAGVALVAAIMMWPIVGLVMVILSGTCLQILGSSHITGLPISFGKLFGALTLLSWGIQFVRKRSTMTVTPLFVPLLVFLLVVANSILMCIFDVARSSYLPMAMEGLFRLLQLYLFVFLIANIGGESRLAFRIVLATTVAATATCGVIALAEQFIPSLAIEPDDPRLAQGVLGAVIESDTLSAPIKRSSGGMGHPNWLAYNLAVVAPLCVYYWQWSHRFVPIVLTVLAGTLQLLGIAASYTRTGFLALGVAVVYLVWKRRLPILPVAVVALVGAIVGILWLQPQFLERMFSTRYLAEGSTGSRKEIAYAAVRAVLEKPILGHGYGQFGYSAWSQIRKMPYRESGAWGDFWYQTIEKKQDVPEQLGAHCLYLEVWIEYGLIGLIPFLAVLWFIRRDHQFVEFNGNAEDRDLAVCLTAGLISYFICGWLGHAVVLKMIWILAGLSAALRRIVHDDRRAEADVPASG